MLVCIECGHIFEEPKHYVEKHGFTYGPYEEWDGCPICNGGYTEAYRCACCDEWINGDYIKTDNGLRFCENCCVNMELGDEN